MDSRELFLKETEEGLMLTDGLLSVRGDFKRSLNRIGKGNLEKELLIRAARGRSKAGSRGENSEKDELPLAIDATAGLGEDSILLAAAGFRVIMLERDPLIYALLSDSLKRGQKDPELMDIVSRMEAIEGDSIEWMKRAEGSAITPEILLLDPMFPKRNKSGLTKKKLQLIQSLEEPCDHKEEEELLAAARLLHPKKIIVKRPLKGPFLAGVNPSYSIKGSVIRYDVIVT